MHKASHLSSETETFSCKKTLFLSQNCLTHGNKSVLMNLFSTEIVYLFPEITVGVVKETKSATMNIFSIFFYFLFKSFVKVELSYVFTINLFTIAENCTEK